jgi:hypothetical protein
MYSGLLSLFTTYAHIGIDILPSEGETGARPTGPAGFMSDSDFFNILYHPRDEESVLARDLQTSRPLLVVGPPGSGKTSLVRKVLRDQSARDPQALVFFPFDLRKIFGRDEFLEIRARRDSLAFAQYFHRKTRERYFSHLYRPDQTIPNGPHAGRNALIALYDYCLTRAGSPESEDFADLTDEQDEAHSFRDRFQRSRSAPGRGRMTQPSTYVEWLESTDDESVRQFKTRLRSKIGLPHLTQATANLYGYRKQLLWLDNADALTGQEQLHIFQYVMETQNALKSWLQTAVCLREENIKSWVIGEDDQPIASTRIEVSVPSLGSIPTFRLSTRTKDAWSNEVVRRRLTFSLNIYQQARRRDPEFGPQLDNFQIEQFRRSADRLASLMENEFGLLLCNGSLREFLRLHAELLRRFVGLCNDLHTDPDSVPQWFLVTQFLAWLREGNGIYSVGSYDIAGIITHRHLTNPAAPNCILEHLVVTGTWNLQLQGNQSAQYKRHPHFRDLKEKLLSLGFSENEISRATLAMAKSSDSSSAGLIGFAAASDFDPLETPDDKSELFVTPKGRCLTGWTCNTFGFVLQSIVSAQELLTAGAQEGQQMIRNLLTGGLPLAIQKVTSFLCDLGSLYAEGLIAVRTRYANRGGDWLQAYRRDFGIPSRQNWPYSRHLPGTKLGSTYQGLHFEALLDHILAFTRNHAKTEDEKAAMSELVALKRLFIQFLQNLEVVPSQTPKIPDFRSIAPLANRADWTRP